MFGNFGFSNYEEDLKNAEIINQKLNDNTNPPSLEDLLVLDGIVEELQNKNKSLINFFTKETIKQMLDYIIKEPKDDDYNKGHKFPFVCSKLFNIEEKKIMNYFHLTNNELSQLQKNEIIASQKNNNMKKSDEQKNDLIDNNDDNLAKYYKISNHDNFEDDNFDEVNMDDINMNNIENGGIKEENKDDIDIDDNVNYKDDNDNYLKDKIKENKNINGGINNEDNLKDFEINNEDKKEDEDDLVNHFDEEFENKNKINKDEDKENKIIEDKNGVKVDENEDDLINFQDENDLNEKNGEKKENEEEIKTKETEVKNPLEEKMDNYPEDRIEILDYFLSFVLTDAELNYVLCGYFSSLMTILLNKCYFKIINYLFFKRKDVLMKFIYHSYRKSIAETLYKIINYEDKRNKSNLDFDGDFDNSDIEEELDFKNLSEIRLEIIQGLFDIININMDSEKLSSMSYLIQDLTKNKNIFQTIINSKYIINSLITKQLGELNLINSDNDINIFDQKNNFITICDIIILWLTTIKELDLQTPMLLYEVNEEDDEDTVQQNSSPSPELHHTVLSQALIDILPNLIKNNFNENKTKDDIIIQSFKDEKITPLGLYKIKIVELITNCVYYFRNIPNEFDNVIIKSDFIPNAMNYIFKYANNNIYQEALFRFFKSIFKKEEGCPEHEILYGYIFSKFNLLEKIKTNFPTTQENEGNMGLGYVPFLVSLSYKINSVIGGKPLNLEKNYAQEGSITFTTRGRNPRLNGINLSFNIINSNEKEDKEEIISSKIIKSLEKYCNDEWKYFFSEKISNKIRLYENYLCDIKNKSNSINKDDDLFYNPVNDEEKEDLLGFGNKRYYNKDNKNKLEFENNNENNKNMASYKDMEININDFNFNDNEEINMNDINNNEENNEFNSVNYWKNDLEKEKNSYYNVIGEEAMNDLLEE